jgi:hypothetical protein
MHDHGFDKDRVLQQAEATRRFLTGQTHTVVELEDKILKHPIFHDPQASIPGVSMDSYIDKTQLVASGYASDISIQYKTRGRKIHQDLDRLAETEHVEGGVDALEVFYVIHQLQKIAEETGPGTERGGALDKKADYRLEHLFALFSVRPHTFGRLAEDILIYARKVGHLEGKLLNEKAQKLVDMVVFFAEYHDQDGTSYTGSDSNH